MKTDDIWNQNQIGLLYLVHTHEIIFIASTDMSALLYTFMYIYIYIYIKENSHCRAPVK